MKIQCLRRSLFVYLLLGASLLSGNALAAVLLDAPRSVGRGNAFVVTASSDEPAGSIVFSWRGKKYPVTAEATDRGWAAGILLPAPLDMKENSAKVGASAGTGPETVATVRIVDVKRPVQKLQVDKKFVNPPAEVTARIQADREKVRKALAQGRQGRMWDLPLARPVPGSVSSQFGLKRVFNGQLRGEHRGLDLRGQQGTPIHACADGIVALVDDLYYSGNTVYVDHGDGVFSAYLHMSATDVRPGERVKRGQVIGRVGATGRVTGPHLHLSVLAQGAPVDPLPLLETSQSQNKGGKNAR